MSLKHEPFSEPLLRHLRLPTTYLCILLGYSKVDEFVLEIQCVDFRIVSSTAYGFLPAALLHRNPGP